MHSKPVNWTIKKLRFCHPVTSNVKTQSAFMDHPPIFKVGLVTLWVSLGFEAIAFSIIKATYYFGNDLLSSVFTFMPLVLMAFLAYRISKRNNWARIFALIWFLVLILPGSFIKSIPIALSLLSGSTSGSTWLVLVPSALIATSAALKAFSLYVFFTKPSSLLFRQKMS